MPQRWRAVGNTVPDLTAPRFKPQTSRSRDERLTGLPLSTNWPVQLKQSNKPIKKSIYLLLCNAYFKVIGQRCQFLFCCGGRKWHFCCILVVCCAVFEHIFDFYEVCSQIVKNTSVLAENFLDIQYISLNTNKQMRTICNCICLDNLFSLFWMNWWTWVNKWKGPKKFFFR